MKTMITPFALGVCLWGMMMAGCQKENEVLERAGYQQYVVQSANGPVALEVSHDRENVYLRVGGPAAEVDSTRLTYIYFHNCDSLRANWNPEANIQDLNWTVHTGRDTSWTVAASADSHYCMCMVLMADGENPRGAVRGDQDNSAGSQLHLGTLDNPIRYCFN